MKKIMQKFLTLIFCLMTITFACENSHETIYGITIGCELSTKDNAVMRKLSTQNIGLTKAYTFSDLDFFDSVEIETDKDNISRVATFSKEYIVNKQNIESQYDLIYTEFNQIYNDLENRWGKFNVKNADLLLDKGKKSISTFLTEINYQSVEITQPNSDVIGWIMLIAKSDDKQKIGRNSEKHINLYLIYVDKTTLEKAKKFYAHSN